jgi:hypothetical protein
MSASLMTPLTALISNPYVAAPLLFGFAILFVVAFVPQSAQSSFSTFFELIHFAFTF